MLESLHGSYELFLYKSAQVIYQMKVMRWINGSVYLSDLYVKDFFNAKSNLCWKF